MKTPFKYINTHTCEAVVLTCIDFRFWEAIVRFVREDLRIGDFDFPSLPGAAKAINDCQSENDLAMKCISVPCDLHRIKKIVIINHWDCGAYGGSKNFSSREEELNFHRTELKKAKEKIKAKYPNKEVILVLAKISDDEKNIEFLTIS